MLRKHFLANVIEALKLAHTPKILNEKANERWIGQKILFVLKRKQKMKIRGKINRKEHKRKIYKLKIKVKL